MPLLTPAELADVWIRVVSAVIDGDGDKADTQALHAHIDAQAEQIRRLRESLEWYAARATDGERARAALKETESR